MSAHLYDEGHTVAGWTGFGIATAGSGLVGLGVCTGSVAAVGGGLAVVVLSVFVTWGLHLSGWGKPPGVRPREQWGMRVRDPLAREGHSGCVGCRLAGRGRRRAVVVVPEGVGTELAESVPLSPFE
ncbi:HGxxPAAW family protein [Streptomyces sp. NPDC001480]|uniref:HGxxPAAW family protein n=1 Tax=Streptomyces sp. NPDC001480 TaxID=3364577 RepID=UPI0036AF6529